jgi:hypothetical protein
MKHVELKILKSLINAKLVGWIDATKKFNKDEISINNAIYAFQQRYNLDQDVFTIEMLSQMYYRWKNNT